MSTLHVVLVVIAVELATLLSLFLALVTMHVRKSGAKIRKYRRFWVRLLPEALEGRRKPTVRIKESIVTDANFKLFHEFMDEQLRQLGSLSSSAATAPQSQVGFHSEAPETPGRVARSVGPSRGREDPGASSGEDVPGGGRRTAALRRSRGRARRRLRLGFISRPQLLPTGVPRGLPADPHHPSRHRRVALPF